MARHFARLDGFAETEAWYARITERDGFRQSLPGGESGRIYDRDFYEAWDG